MILELAPLVMALILFHTADGLPVYINPHAVTSIRAPRGQDHHVHGDVKCLINLEDTKWVGVKESCDMVRAAVDAAQKEKE